MTLRAPRLVLRCPPRDSLCRSAVLTAFRARAGPRASHLAAVGRPLPAWGACFVCPFVFFFRFRVKVKLYSVRLHLSFLNDDDYFLWLISLGIVHFSKEDTRTTNSHTERCSTSPVIKDMQIETTARCRLAPVHLSEGPSAKSASAGSGEGAEREGGALGHCWQECKREQPPRKAGFGRGAPRKN